MRFRVQLDMFSGPMDLMWYLVRKHELDILDMPIALVTEQQAETIAFATDGQGLFTLSEGQDQPVHYIPLVD